MEIFGSFFRNALSIAGWEKQVRRWSLSSWRFDGHPIPIPRNSVMIGLKELSSNGSRTSALPSTNSSPLDKEPLSMLSRGGTHVKRIERILIPGFSDPVEIRAPMDSQNSNTLLPNPTLMSRDRSLVKWCKFPMKPMHDSSVTLAA